MSYTIYFYSEANKCSVCRQQSFLQRSWQMSRLRFEIYIIFALSAKIIRPRNNKVVLQEWNNAAVKQAFPILRRDVTDRSPAHLVLLQWF